MRAFGPATASSCSARGRSEFCAARLRGCAARGGGRRLGTRSRAAGRRHGNTAASRSSATRREWAQRSRRPGRRRRRRCDRRFGRAGDGARPRPPGRLDQQSRLGTAAARLLARSARAEERHAARQLQPQLADLGTRHSLDRDRERSTCGRSPAASGRSPQWHEAFETMHSGQDRESGSQASKLEPTGDA